MLEYSFRPLTHWPGDRTPSSKQKRSPFDARYTATLDLLERELRHLRAHSIVFEADCESSEIRNDGRLRSSAKLRSPGIIVNFDSPSGPMRFPCDMFTNWEANLRAIALTLERLRAVDRYGVTKHGEQYSGWKALPSPETKAPTKQAAANWLSTKMGDVAAEAISPFRIIDHRDVRDHVRKRLIVLLHPDRRGSDIEFKQLMEFMAVLEA